MNTLPLGGLKKLNVRSLPLVYSMEKLTEFSLGVAFTEDTVRSRGSSSDVNRMSTGGPDGVDTHAPRTT